MRDSVASDAPNFVIKHLRRKLMKNTIRALRAMAAFVFAVVVSLCMLVVAGAAESSGGASSGIDPKAIVALVAVLFVIVVILFFVLAARRKKRIKMEKYRAVNNIELYDELKRIEWESRDELRVHAPVPPEEILEDLPVELKPRRALYESVKVVEKDPDEAILPTYNKERTSLRTVTEAPSSKSGVTSVKPLQDRRVVESAGDRLSVVSVGGYSVAANQINDSSRGSSEDVVVVERVQNDVIGRPRTKLAVAPVVLTSDNSYVVETPDNTPHGASSVSAVPIVARRNSAASITERPAAEIVGVKSPSAEPRHTSSAYIVEKAASVPAVESPELPKSAPRTVKVVEKPVENLVGIRPLAAENAELADNVAIAAVATDAPCADAESVAEPDIANDQVGLGVVAIGPMTSISPGAPGYAPVQPVKKAASIAAVAKEEEKAAPAVEEIAPAAPVFEPAPEVTKEPVSVPVTEPVKEPAKNTAPAVEPVSAPTPKLIFPVFDFEEVKEEKPKSEPKRLVVVPKMPKMDIYMGPESNFKPVPSLEEDPAPIIPAIVPEPVEDSAPEIIEEPASGVVIEDVCGGPFVESAPAPEVVEEPVEEPAPEVVEEPVEEPTPEVVEEPVEEPAPEVVEEPVEEPTPEVVEEPVEEPAPEVIEEPVEESAPEVVEKPVEEPAPEVVEEPVEEPAPEVAPIALGENEGTRLINGEIVLVHYRSSFMSRLIQADADIQDYYTIIKNVLLSYKGVKARSSWSCESFNKGRLQCAKLNVKGRTITLYLALDPKDYIDSKYHFTDVSDKPKFDKVPMLVKVRSDRALKYAVELIEEMMAKLGVVQGAIPDVDYHMPYETTEELVERDLVKVILPAGMSLDENANVVKLNVGDLIESHKSESSDEAEEPIEDPALEVVEEPIEEPAPEVVEEPVEEPAPEVVEEPVEEPAPEVVEEPVEEPAPEVVEEPVEEPAPEVIEEPIEESTPEVIEEPIEESTPEVVEEPIEEPAPEVIEEPIEESTPEVVEEPVEEPAPEVVEEPVEEPAPEVVKEPVEEPAPEVVEEPAEDVMLIPDDEGRVHVDASHADDLVTDEQAESEIQVISSGKKASGKMVEINIDTICDNFEDGETVDLEALKAKRLVPKNAARLKVLARGVMTKNNITLIADKFSIQAVKMIILAGGKAERVI